MQTCPNCQEQCPDEGNYCQYCRAKLPNAKEGMPDYRKIKESPDIDPNEIVKLFWECFEEPDFRERLLSKILLEAVRAIHSLDEKKQYMGKEALRISFREAMRYAGCYADTTSDEGEK